jgi:hypothetical protein
MWRSGESAPAIGALSGGDRSTRRLMRPMRIDGE